MVENRRKTNSWTEIQKNVFLNIVERRGFGVSLHFFSFITDVDILQGYKTTLEEGKAQLLSQITSLL